MQNLVLAHWSYKNSSGRSQLTTWQRVCGCGFGDPGGLSPLRFMTRDLGRSLQLCEQPPCSGSTSVKWSIKKYLLGLLGEGESCRGRLVITQAKGIPHSPGLLLTFSIIHIQSINKTLMGLSSRALSSKMHPESTTFSYSTSPPTLHPTWSSHHHLPLDYCSLLLTRLPASAFMQ